MSARIVRQPVKAFQRVSRSALIAYLSHNDPLGRRRGDEGWALVVLLEHPAGLDEVGVVAALLG